MSSPAILRPGIAVGAYPERRDPRESASDRMLRVLKGRLDRRLHARRSRLADFVERVERAGAGLEADGHAALRERGRELSRELVVKGLRDDLLAPLFALIREMARRTLGTPHYGVQLMGGWVMARGMLAEMETGEGKTLTATLPACAAALAGIPVHVISANDYLVARDAEAMRPLYRAFGLTVGAATEADKAPETRRAAYACDVVYATGKTLAFDYLRDGLVRGRGRGAGRGPSQPTGGGGGPSLLLRGLCFAIVDEADSVLIDEARTPLILSAPGGSPEQRRTYRQALRLAADLEPRRDFRLEPGKGRIELTPGGRERLAEAARPLTGFWTGPRRREEWVLRALRALHLFERDRDYLVRDDKVQIIDGPTGRVSPDRSWERGIHQLIEVKEGCTVTPERETIARISYQQLFRRYLRLAGMTGTAREVGSELWAIYGLNTLAVPTRLPRRRASLGTRVFAREDSKWAAVVESVREARNAGRPVLVGTRSVAASEHLSELLSRDGIPHRVLNARQDAEEADIVAQAGQPGRVTVATNMAGRGTDIRLAPGVAEAGGLHVIACERSEARRIDRQLFGRCARQGDPGSHEAVLSLEDRQIARFYPAAILRGVARVAGRDGRLPAWPGKLLTSLPQRAEEGRHARARRSLVDLEDYLGELLAFSGSPE